MVSIRFFFTVIWFYMIFKIKNNNQSMVIHRDMKIMVINMILHKNVLHQKGLPCISNLNVSVSSITISLNFLLSKLQAKAK